MINQSYRSHVEIKIISWNWWGGVIIHHCMFMLMKLKIICIIIHHIYTCTCMSFFQNFLKINFSDRIQILLQLLIYYVT